MKLISLYQVRQWDGGERHNATDICFETEEKVKEFLGEKSYDTYMHLKYTVYDSVEEYENTKSQRVREQALAKLTDIEKKALGLI